MAQEKTLEELEQLFRSPFAPPMEQAIRLVEIDMKLRPDFDLGSAVCRKEDPLRTGRIVLYRPYPHPTYGVEFSPRGSDYEWLFVNGHDGLNRLYAISWVAETNLQAAFPAPEQGRE